MSKKHFQKGNVSKEAESNVAAGKPGSTDTTKETTNVPDSTQPGKIDLSEIVRQVAQSYAATPEKLDKLINVEIQHAEVIRETQKRLGEIKHTLYPGKDAIAKGLAYKPSSIEREKLLGEKSRLMSMLRTFKKSNRFISRDLIDNGKAERRAIRLEDLRDIVKDPTYYNRYGKHIVPAFVKWMGTPMTRELHPKLVQAKEAAANGSTDALAKVLLIENPALYIRSTGNRDRKAEYLAEFSNVLAAWQPDRAIIKKQF